MPPHRPPTPRLVPLLLLSGLALAGAPLACSSTEEARDVSWYVQHGRYAKAQELAREEVARRPEDPGARRVLQQTEVAGLLHLGRTALFDGDAELALELFYRALARDPESPHAATWIRKTRNQIAEQWLDVAQAHTSEADLESARLAYEKVLEHVLPEADGAPDRVREVQQQAQLGLARVLLRMNYRSGQSETYYREGLHAFRNWLLQEARTHFEKAEDFEESELIADRRERVEELLAHERLLQARELEATGFYFAARNEYRLVLLVDPDNEAAKAGLDRMDRESRSSRMMSEAEMSMLRGELDKARLPIEDAKALTRAQVDRIALLEWQVEDARLRQMYDEAVDLERDFRYLEAIEAYSALLDETEFYEDAIARRDTVQWLVDSADALYAQAVAAEDPEERFRLLWEIQNVVWPEFRDVEQRLAALRAEGLGVASGEVDLMQPPEPKLYQPAARRRSRTFGGAPVAGEQPVEPQQVEETGGENPGDH